MDNIRRGIYLLICIAIPQMTFAIIYALYLLIDTEHLMKF